MLIFPCNNLLYNSESLQALSLPIQPNTMQQNNSIYNIKQQSQEETKVQPQPHQLQPTEQGMVEYSIVQPPVPSNVICPPVVNISAQTSICRVDQMTVEQTANWVRTFGTFQGWSEAEEYAQQFKKNSISGLSLFPLTHELLEVNLGVKNYNHRMQLLNTIQWLFADVPHQPTYVIPVPQPVIAPIPQFLKVPNVDPNESKRQAQESDCASQTSNYLASSNNSVHGSIESDYESSYYSIYHASAHNEVDAGQTDLMSESGWSTAGAPYLIRSRRSHADVFTGAGNFPEDGLSMPPMTACRKSHCVNDDQEDVVMTDHREDTLSIRSMRRARYKKLILELKPEQIIKGASAIDIINRRLLQFGHVADIKPMEGRPNTYILSFPGSEMAQECFHQADEIGYKFEKKWPPRPSPSRPIRFKSLRCQQILSGKAFSGEHRGILKADVTVVVNQVKGRRARLVEIAKGVVKNIGWVSVHNPEGMPLLEQLDDF